MQQTELSMKDVTPKAKDRVRVPATGIHRPQDSGSILSVIAAAAADPRCDVAKMKELLSMEKEIRAEQARIAFIDAKLALTFKLPTINKDGKIEFKDKGAGKATLKYASFENINDIIKPLLHDHEFDLWFSSEPGAAAMINVIGHLTHRMGFERTTTFPMPHDASGGKSGAQGWASAFSFGKRVTTIGLLNIQTRALEDRDRDGNEGNFKRSKEGFAEVPAEVEKISEDQMVKMRDLIEWCGVPQKKFLEHYGIAKVSDLPADMFDAAKKACEDFHANREAKAKHG